MSCKICDEHKTNKSLKSIEDEQLKINSDFNKRIDVFNARLKEIEESLSYIMTALKNMR